MKLGLIFGMVALLSTPAFAGVSSLEFETSDGKVTVALLDGQVDESEAELLYEQGGQEAIFEGKICYNGSRTDARTILNQLSDMEILGDEYDIRNFRFVGRDRFKFDIFDGPNEVISATHTVLGCAK